MVQPASSWIADDRGGVLAVGLARGAAHAWADLVHEGLTEAELATLRNAVRRGCPFGEASWSDQVVRRLGLETTIRAQGRPRKQDAT